MDRKNAVVAIFNSHTEAGAAAFAGARLFIPARSPYDRQVLVEHVADRARRTGQVQVLVDDERWLVQWSRSAAVNCGSCGFSGDVACRCASDDAQTYCVRCAFGDRMRLANRAAIAS